MLLATSLLNQLVCSIAHVSCSFDSIFKLLVWGVESPLPSHVILYYDQLATIYMNRRRLHLDKQY